MAMFIVNAWIIKLNCQQNCSVSTCSVVNCRMYLCKSACGQYSIQLDIYFHKKSGYYSTVCGGDTATQKGSLSPGLVMVIKCVLLLNQLLTRPVIAILPLEILILILTLCILQVSRCSRTRTSRVRSVTAAPTRPRSTSTAASRARGEAACGNLTTPSGTAATSNIELYHSSLNAIHSIQKVSCSKKILKALWASNYG